MENILPQYQLIFHFLIQTISYKNNFLSKQSLITIREGEWLNFFHTRVSIHDLVINQPGDPKTTI